MNHNNDNNQIIKRLNIARGHLNKVASMVENDSYCIDIIHQSQAVQAALKNIDRLILQNHLNTCVVDAIKKGNKKEVIKEVLEIFEKNK